MTSQRTRDRMLSRLREQGIKAGLFRPKTLLPFPSKQLKDAAQGKQFVLVAELSLGQMLVDVKLAIEGTVPVHFYGRTGGVIFEPSEIVDAVKSHRKGD